ncbi:MAG TPA: hypothetical protein VGD65_13075 [Chryseosolibacter sp.]
MSAEVMGMGNTSSCHRSEWSLLTNIGGLAEVSSISVSFSQYAVPSFKPFNRTAATIAAPVGVGAAGAAFFRFGDALYNEQLISAGYSNKFGLASLGLKVNYIQYYAEGFGRSGAFTVSFGGIAEITKQFSVGAIVENINQPTLSTETESRIPTRFMVGTEFKLSKKVLAITELEKELEHDPVIRAGIAYELYKKLTARTGFNVNPQSAFGGFGVKLKKFTLDYAFQFHEYLGAAHQATVRVSLTKNK